MMKIEHLRYFLTVARVGSTNKAAEELFLTSQNLGLIMKNIEKELEKLLCYTMGKDVITLEDVETVELF